MQLYLSKNIIQNSQTPTGTIFYCAMSTFTLDTLSALLLLAHYSQFSLGFERRIFTCSRVFSQHISTFSKVKDLNFFHHWVRVSRKISVRVH